MLIRCAYLLNPGKQPIPEAALWIQGDQIRFSGSCTELPKEALREEKCLELKNQVVCPGLVNAHAHLELTALEGMPYPGSFVSWIRQVLAAKNNLSNTSQSEEMIRGIALALLGGTTTIGDHLSVQGDIESLLDSPLRGRSFIEILGVNPEVAEDIWEAGLSLIHAYEAYSTRIKISLSPHSVHALSSSVLNKVLKKNFECFSIHLGESDAEEFYFKDKCGEMYDLIAERGSCLTRDVRSAIAELKANDLLNSKILAVHANYCTEQDIKDLSDCHASVVHCPYSHDYFSHRPFAFQSFIDAKVNLALGTDSLSSAKTLSMLDVLRRTRESSGLSEETVFSMATIGGAKALKLEKEIGELIPGKKADLIGIPMGKESPVHSLFQAKEVAFTMIGGAPLALNTEFLP